MRTYADVCGRVQVFEEADSQKSGYIDFDDFARVVMNTDIEGKLSFDF
jgi:Ca2+-binding EF-hand superfamily protein